MYESLAKMLMLVLVVFVSQDMAQTPVAVTAGPGVVMGDVPEDR